MVRNLWADVKISIYHAICEIYLYSWHDIHGWLVIAKNTKEGKKTVWSDLRVNKYHVLA